MKIQALRARFTVSSVNLILLPEIATVVPPCRAEAPNMHDAEFRTFYAQFSKAEFLRKYDSFFTPFMRAHVLKTKPQKISDDHYAAIWRDSNAEFSFQLENVGGRGFRITAYGIGPW